eukprot:1428681-Rhodomonas_salina.1
MFSRRPTALSVTGNDSAVSNLSWTVWGVQRSHHGRIARINAREQRLPFSLLTPSVSVCLFVSLCVYVRVCSA